MTSEQQFQQISPLTVIAQTGGNEIAGGRMLVQRKSKSVFTFKFKLLLYALLNYSIIELNLLSEPVVVLTGRVPWMGPSLTTHITLKTPCW